MEKKEYVLKVLDLLKDDMPLARGLSILIQKSDVDENMIDTLIESFKESLKNIKDEQLKNKLEKATNFLDEIKKREADSKKLDEQDIQHLDDMLANM